MADPIRASIHIEAQPERVFAYFTDPEAMVRWMGQHATLQPSTGGAFEVDRLPHGRASERAALARPTQSHRSGAGGRRAGTNR